jgi:hypothetical protein
MDCFDRAADRFAGRDRRETFDSIDRQSRQVGAMINPRGLAGGDSGGKPSLAGCVLDAAYTVPMCIIAVPSCKQAVQDIKSANENVMTVHRFCCVAALAMVSALSTAQCWAQTVPDVVIRVPFNVGGHNGFDLSDGITGGKPTRENPVTIVRVPRAWLEAQGLPKKAHVLSVRYVAAVSPEGVFASDPHIRKVRKDGKEVDEIEFVCTVINRVGDVWRQVTAHFELPIRISYYSSP